MAKKPPAERKREQRKRDKLGIALPTCMQCNKTKMKGVQSLATGICGYCRAKNSNADRQQKFRDKNKVRFTP